jgi:hypothetical protein
MKAVVGDGHSRFTTIYINHTNSYESVVRYVEGIEVELLKIVLKQMNMTFLYIHLPERSELGVEYLESYLVMRTITKETDIFLGNVGNYILTNPFLDSTNT